MPAAVLVVVLGIVPWHAARRHGCAQIGPTVGFLAAILVFGHLCAEAGVFDYLGARRGAGQRAGRPAPAARPRRRAGRRVTATLTLDATVVLLTPVVLATTGTRSACAARPHAYACTRLANSGSLLLPVSNLTNLLAFTRPGLSFGRFTALMVAAVGARRARPSGPALRDVLPRATSPSRGAPARGRRRAAPRYALVVLAVTVALFVVTSSVDVAPAWAALAGCVALLVPRLRRRDVHPAAAASREASPGLLRVRARAGGRRRRRHPARARRRAAALLPAGTSFLALLGLAALAAAARQPREQPAGDARAACRSSPATRRCVLAVLLGVNIGPNATYPGSLATLLWRRLLPAARQAAGRASSTCSAC